MTPEEQQALIDAALAAARQAYAPYSKFQVGAALAVAGGAIFSGCNVENASYGLTICAERVAVGAAVSAGHQEFRAMAIASQGAATPCGACRQVLAEFAGSIPILLVDTDSGQAQQSVNLSELLPLTFKR